MEGWDRPVSHEWLVLADLFDLQHRAASDPKKPAPKPYPRPFKVGATERRKGSAAGRTPDEVKAILRAHGHNLN